MSKKRRNKKVYHPHKKYKIFGKPQVGVTRYVPPKQVEDRTPLIELYPDAILVEGWDELMEYAEMSETHVLEIDRRMCNGWIKPRYKESERDWNNQYYLSTHTFYGFTDERFGGSYRDSTKALQKFGFNLIIKNWDGETI